MNQTVFNYPDKDTSLKILDLIFNDRTEDAYDILSEFYHVSKISVIHEPEGFDEFDKLNRYVSCYYYHNPKEEYPRESRSSSTNHINFRMNIYRRTPSDVLHEFYHHLEDVYYINGVLSGTQQTADSWAYWFLQNIGPIGEIYYIQTSDSRYLKPQIRFLEAVKNEDRIDRIRKLKKGTRRLLTPEHVFYSRQDKTYHITSLGEMLIEHMKLSLSLHKEWKKTIREREEINKHHNKHLNQEASK